MEGFSSRTNASNHDESSDNIVERGAMVKEGIFSQTC
jgi:hypothetical protein